MTESIPAVPAPIVPMRWIDTMPVESTDKPCIVASLDTRVHVAGLYADITETMEISNPNPRDISVNITLPMPDRAVVCGYALDIDGEMRDGVVVPKEKARVAFETEQRLGADPGLVESVKGNVYQTRIYPVPANGKRTVRLRYVAPLLVIGGTSAFLDVPMPEEHLAKRTLEIAVELLDCPAPELSGVNIPALREVGTCWMAELAEEDIAPDAALRIALPKLPGSFALVEKGEDGQLWFSASAAAPAQEEKVRPLETLTVIWDASGSRADVDHAPELTLVRSYLDGVKNARLIAFGEHAQAPEEFKDADALVARIGELRYDGGSDFAALAKALGELPQAEACVLFTDGMDTLSASALDLPRQLKCLAVVAGTERDIESLRQACGGLAFDIAAAPKDAESLARALFCSNLLSGFDGKNISEVAGVGSGGDGRFSVLGKLDAQAGSVSFEGTDIAFELDGAKAREGSTISRAWAAIRVAQLSPRSDDNADELLSLGRRFGVVSPATSLLVLERLDQWLRYEIEPPASWEKMHREWERHRAGVMKHSSEEGMARDHLEALKREWAGLVKWWQTDFSAVAADADASCCPRCGAALPEGAAFCSACGAPVNEPVAVTSAMPDSATRGAGAMFNRMAETVASALPRRRASMRESTSYSAAGAVMEQSYSAPEGIMEDCCAAEAAPQMRMEAARVMGSASVNSASMDGLRRAVFSVDEDQAEDISCDPLEQPDVAVKIQPWMPDAAYLKALDEALGNGIEKARGAYFEQRADNASSPAFFIDCAGWFMANGDAAFGVQVLTNLAEMRIEDAALLRVMAWRLREAGELERALAVLRHVLKLRPEDSQSHRDVALVLDELAREAYSKGLADDAKAYAEEAAGFYRKIATTPWQRRAMAIALFAVEEYNVMRAWADAQEWKGKAPELESLGEGLEGVLECDIRITLAWDADETDVDIHVTEPGGEEAYYGNRNTHSGGRVSEDITDGYGPELYEIRRAREGLYDIRAHYYASHQQTVFGPASCTLTVYTDWGRPNQAKQITSTRLEKQNEMVPVGTAVYGTAEERERYEREHDGKQDGTADIVKGASPALLIEAYGQPSEGDADVSDGQLKWELAGGRVRVATFGGGKLEELVETMSWGEELVIVR